MKIKQQQQIHLFLIEEFGKDRASELFIKQEKALGMLIKHTKNKSKNQMKMLVQTILPRIALYQILVQDGLSEEDIHEHMRKYMREKVGAQKHSSTAKMEAIPGFYFLYSRIFLKVVRTSDLWESEQHYSKDHFEVTMKNVSGIRHVWKMAVQNCVRCFVK